MRATTFRRGGWTLTVQLPTVSGERVSRDRIRYRQGKEAVTVDLEAWEREVFLEHVRKSGLRFLVKSGFGAVDYHGRRVEGTLYSNGGRPGIRAVAVPLCAYMAEYLASDYEFRTWERRQRAGKSSRPIYGPTAKRNGT